MKKALFSLQITKKSNMKEHKALFRFYEELNDFLPERWQKRAFHFHFNGHPAVKDPIEAIGVPHTEVDLVLVNGESVPFSHQIKDGDYISVYPVFESLDISPIVKLRDAPLRKTVFVLDVHLGTLARTMRLLGFDVTYENDLDDPQIVAISLKEHRIILTRDRRLLYAKEITHGYFVRNTNPDKQIIEILKRFDLVNDAKPFSRCSACNGEIETVKKDDVLHLLEPKTIAYFDDFMQCESCKNVYWHGSHMEHIEKKIESILRKAAKP